MGGGDPRRTFWRHLLTCICATVACAAFAEAGDAAARAASPLADARFAAAWRRALGPRAGVRWLAHLDGPSGGAVTVDVGGRRMTQYAVCKPHDCYDNNALLLYDAASGVVVAALLESGGPMTLLGAPSPAIAAELGRRWRAEFRQSH